jgi:hypothetical protein
MRQSRILRAMAAAALASVFVLSGATAAGASEHRGRFPVDRHEHGDNHFHGTSTCTGTPEAPGLLAGTYRSNVVVTGVCVVDGGAAKVRGNLVIAPGAGLNATFALDDQPGGTGASSLTVNGNVIVQRDGLLAMGCEPNFSTCTDDPDQVHGGTLTGQNHVYGSLSEWHALGAIVHASTVGGDVTELGGGGGVSCDPPFPGLFGALQSPAFSDYEDNTIGGDLTVAGLQTCWLGMLRNNVHGNLGAFHNTMADPDAGEIVQNTVHRDIACVANDPASQFGDSGASPNVVSGHAFGQCGFNVYQPDPNYPNGDGTGGPQPISVKAPHGPW